MIVGGGPAGLSAGLILARCRRRVLVCDAGRPRNAAAHALHGFLTRDGTPPGDILQIARDQLRQYPNLEFIEAEAVDGRRLEGGFEIGLGDGSSHRCRLLLLATGVVDQLPPIPEIEAFYGRSVLHCPYCDGWEWRDQPLALYGRGHKGTALALELTLWSRDLVLCTDGPMQLSHEDYGRLLKQNIPVREERIERLEGTDGMLQRIVFESGRRLARRALFFGPAFRQSSGLPMKLGCDLTEEGVVPTGTYETTSVPGLYVAGDAGREVQLAIVAAAEGAKAAFSINTALLQEDLR